MAARLLLVRALWRCVGHGLVRRLLVFGTGLAIVASIVFAPQGLRAVDVLRAWHAGQGFRLIFAAVWTGMTVPVVSGVLDGPGTRMLRALRPAPAAWAAALLVVLLPVEIPCAILFGRGEGVGAALLASGLSLSLVNAVLAWHTWTARLVLVAALALVVLDPSPWLGVLPAFMLAFLAAHRGWSSALDRSERTFRLVRPSTPLLALLAVHLLALVRIARGRLAVAGAAIAIGAAVLDQSLQNDPPLRPLSRALAVLALPLALSAAVLAAPLLKVDRQLRPLARVTGTRRMILTIAFLLALATPTSAFAATAGSLVGLTAAAGPPLALGAALGVWALPIAALTGGWSSWCAPGRSARRGPAIFVVGVLLVALLAVLVARSLPL